MNAPVSIPDFSAAVDRAELARVFALQQQRALALRSSTLAARRAKLQKLLDAVLANQAAIIEAGRADLGRPEVETVLMEVSTVVGEARHTLKHLKRWMKPRKVGTPLTLFGSSGEVRVEPKGVTLIVAPWNVPVNGLLAPLVSALAAGNTAMLKPSEMAPQTSVLLTKLVRETFAEDEVAVFEGDAAMSQALLELPFNHIFFTGSPGVGRIVMTAAAKHLTSVTLELGGKSPAVIDAGADLKKTAQSLAHGKCINSGQACIAPDYLLVDERIHDALLAELRSVLDARYGATAEARRQTPDYGRMVNARNWQRVRGLLDDAVERGATVAYGGASDEDTRYIEPTLLTGVPAGARILDEEIFGPLLPILKYRDLGEAITHINAAPKPLALYVYARDRAMVERVLRETSSGDAGVNLSMVHFSDNELPFGGVNNSGFGKAHGEWGFKAFSHERSVLKDHFASTQLVAPPYTPGVKRLVEAMLRWFV
ncbi:MAG TPA: aldehyde dehydrogenase family protein [Solimonas sp.]|nr:aldehyde dehydrogenase family protein [Solimonas sp.]